MAWLSNLAVRPHSRQKSLNRFGAKAYLTTCHRSHKQIVQAATQQTVVRAIIGRNATIVAIFADLLERVFA
jgi:hypothetical protein